MPTLSAFYGILIRMFFKDHAPPHFLRDMASSKPRSRSVTLAVMEGELPARALSLVREWAMIHRGDCLRIGGSAARTGVQRRSILWRNGGHSMYSMYWAVVEVKPEPNSCLFVRFKDGLSQVDIPFVLAAGIRVP